MLHCFFYYRLQRKAEIEIGTLIKQHTSHITKISSRQSHKIVPSHPFSYTSLSFFILELYIYHMHNNLLLDGRSDKSSKSKLDFQLPRILKGDQTPNISECTGQNALRFHWLTLPKDYSFTSTSEIQGEYAQLRKELLTLNEQAARNVDRMALRTSKPMKMQGSRLIEVRGKQSQNNMAIIARLRAQLQQLQKRISVLQGTGKDDIEESISQTKEKIVALRHKNKELQQKSKEIGSSIQAGDEVFAQLRKIEVQLGLAQRKKAKLETRWKEYISSMQKVNINLSELTDEAQQAETYIQEQLQSSRVDKEQKKIQFLYRQHCYNLQALKKNEQSVTSLKQQKYHQCLKQLQQITTKIIRTEASIQQAAERHHQQAQEMTDLQQKRKECLQKANMMMRMESRQEQEGEKENEVNDEKFKHTSKVARSLKMTKEIKVQSQSQYGRISYDQQTTKTKLLNLRINKSVSRKAQKANNTIDTLPQDNSNIAALKKKGNVIFKGERLNFSHQEQKNKSKSPAPRMNTVDLLADGKIEQKGRQEFNKDNEYFQNEQIQQEIQASSSMLSQPLIKKQSDKAIENVDKVIEGLQQQGHPLNTKQQKKQQPQQQQEDADLLDFKKSIAAQLNGPYSGIGSIQIALGEIQTTIRQHQSRAKIHNSNKDDPIEEQDQPIQ